MPRLAAAFLAGSFLVACMPSLGAGQVAVVSVFARHTQAVSAGSATLKGSRATVVGVTIGTTRPPPPRRPLDPGEAPDAPGAPRGSRCVHVVLCAWQAHATRSALARLVPAGGNR